MNDTGQNAIYYALLLILPLSALLARGLPFKQVARMALAWVAIFAVGVLIFSQRHRVTPLWNSLHDTVAGADQSVSGSTVRIRMNDDGHFWAYASIDGVKRRMLIDSGATITALSAATASAAGLAIDENDFPEVIDTANGSVAAMPAQVKRLTIDGITAHDLPVVVSSAFGDTDVLGMNFLSRLKSWRVEGTTLILQLNHGDI